MNIGIKEFEGCFCVEMVAETLADAALLTRLGMNATREVRSVTAYVTESGAFSGSIVIGKHCKSDSRVPNRSERREGRK